MDKKVVIIVAILVIVSVILLTLALNPESKPDSQQTPQQANQHIANPASVYCSEQGGVVDIRGSLDGQTGYCVFPGGTECEEWSFYRGECPEEEAPPENQTVTKPAGVLSNRTSIGAVAKTQLLPLTQWTDSKISIDVPTGWEVHTGGECATKSVLARDPRSGLKQLFYFSEAGPVYTNRQAKENDEEYMSMGGYPVMWYDSPVVDPLTSKNYLENFHTLVSGRIIQEVFPEAPIMENINVISVENQDMPSFAADVKLIRAEFTQNGKAGEGYFYVMTADTGVGLGYGIMVVGITAPNGLLDLLAPSLKESIGSFAVSQDYVSACIKAGNKALSGALKTGHILSSTSDVIMGAWETKLETESRMSEQWSDAMLGTTRLYDPDMDEVYEVTPEFLDYYAVHSDEFEMSSLQELPDSKWSYPPLNGGAYIY